MKTILPAFFCSLFCIGNAQEKKSLDSLNALLEAVYRSDQQPRETLDSLEQKFSFDSPQVQEQWRKIHYVDSINLLTVSSVLNKYGWLGMPQLSETAADAIFFVIQHADLAVQKQYLPMLQAAVTNSIGKGWQLAYITDRILINEGKFQLYGSQLFGPKKGELIFYPIANEMNVNKRRKALGLAPLEEHSRGLIKGEYLLPDHEMYDNKFVFMGFVMDQSQQPIAGALIAVGDKLSTRSDDYGRFRLIIPKAGPGDNIIFNKTGFKPQQYLLKHAGKDVVEMMFILEK
jgi:hypothetical protein